jgi:DNA-binding response OmpR family regulator
MRQAGYDVETAADGVEGWEKIRAGRFDLVVTDLHMPKLDGVSLIKLVRESKPTVRIMVYSSDMAEPVFSTLHSLGVTALVPKQANWDILRKMMAGVLRTNP